MNLKKNKAGKLTIPTPKTKSAKVWMTVQVDRQFRNTVTKIADRLGLNISKYLRKKMADLVEAAKYGKLPADAAAFVDLTVCSKCKEKVSD